MVDIKVTVNTDGYVTNFATIGDLLSGSIQVRVIDFDAPNYDCYKLTDGGELVWDEDKYQAKINPPIIELQPSDKERIENLERENALLKAQKQALSEQVDFHEELIVELATQIYA